MNAMGSLEREMTPLDGRFAAETIGAEASSVRFRPYHQEYQRPISHKVTRRTRSENQYHHSHDFKLPITLPLANIAFSSNLTP